MTTGLFAVLATGSTFVSLSTGQTRALLVLNVVGTLIHEAGHALVSVVTGGHVHRVGLTSPESGFTRHSQTWPANIVTTEAGYAMPPLAGLGAAWLLDRGQAAAVLTFTAATMVVLLFVSSDFRTIAFVLTVGVLAFGTLWWGPPGLQSFVACAEAVGVAGSEVRLTVPVWAFRTAGLTV